MLQSFPCVQRALRHASPERRQRRVLQGFVWLAGRGDLCAEWSQAGGILRLGVGGPWYAALPDEAWPAEESARADILKVLAAMAQPCLVLASWFGGSWLVPLVSNFLLVQGCL